VLERIPARLTADNDAPAKFTELTPEDVKHLETDQLVNIIAWPVRTRTKIGRMLKRPTHGPKYLYTGLRRVVVEARNKLGGGGS